MSMTDEEIASYDRLVDVSQGTKDTGYSEATFFYDCLLEVSDHLIVSPPYTGGSGNWKYGFIGIDMLILLGGSLVLVQMRRKKK